MCNETSASSQTTSVGGKRQRREAIAPGTHHSYIRAITTAPPGTLSVWDELSNKAFLVDTGADISVFPVTDECKSKPDRRGLLAANGSSIRTFGSSMIDLQFSGFRVQHPFCVAEVARPILGSDFFLRHDLVIDLPRQRLLRMPLEQSADVVIKARRARVSPALCGLQAAPDATAVGTATCRWEDLFKKFPEVMDSSYDSRSPPKHGICHTIPTDGAPVFARPRRLFGDKLQVAKDEFNNMMKLGIIRPSNSPWSSPLHVVAKPGGG